jgi:hypothetical protein
VDVIVVTPDRSLFDGTVHSLDLPVCPGVLDLRQSVFNVRFTANPVKDMLKGVPVRLSVGELNAVIGQDGMNDIRNGLLEIAQELGCLHFSGLWMQLDKGELAGLVNGHKQIESAFGGLYFGDLDVEIADRVRLEFLSDGLIAFTRLRQAGNPVPFQAAMQ